MNYPSIFYLVLLAIIGLILPVLGVINGDKARDWLINSPEMRVSFYRQTVVSLVVITGLVLLAMFFNNESMTNIGMEFLMEPMLVIVLIASCLVFLIVLNFVPHGGFIRMEKHYHHVMFLVPSNKHQYAWSIVLSFTAGICEELIYRGFLFHQASMYLPVIPAVLLVNIIFGLCHWGSGIKNASWSFGLGVFWSFTYLWTGSLWLAILTHILIDIMSMTIGYKIKQFKSPPSTPTAKQSLETLTKDLGELVKSPYTTNK